MQANSFFLRTIPWLFTLLNSIQLITADPSSGHGGHQVSPSRYVFAHFMVGIVSNRASSSDYDADMRLARRAGIDAFALNIGNDEFTDTQLDYAYASAATNHMKVFLSFDFNSWNPTTSTAAVGAKIAKYANNTAQLTVDNKVFVSTFIGDALNVADLRAKAGGPIFFAPNFSPGLSNFAELDAAFNWMGWPNNGANQAPTASSNLTVREGDVAYMNALAGKDYVAPASPWFFTHYGPEVPYSKNWVFPAEEQWVQRWQDLLGLGARFVEIVSWNDYGESHYVGPLSSPHTDDGNSKWTNDMRHGAWLTLSTPFIRAFHAGATSPSRYINRDLIIYWYRPNPLSLNCDATDTTMLDASNFSGEYFHGKPNGWQTESDSIFVTAFLKSPGNVTVVSGTGAFQFNAVQGVNLFTVPMGVGSQTFGLWRNGNVVLQETSNRNVTEVCGCGNYNFNAYVGRVPSARGKDELLPAGTALLTSGIRVPSEQCVAVTGGVGESEVVAADADASTSFSESTSESSSDSSSTSTSTNQKRSWGLPGRWEWIRGWRDFVDLG
ncbi:glycoside hydrolase family 71 protein [Sclerotinia borealis F-4128]|uniref:Glycoside hydrolase family 71 protein n=1 Tax=Sclerotinia borealis (strain F-4128) TaxID=1432307 RepID=W9C9C5_SCLBF|nr:glycoside hydrolase family 71 protein [Sclerotinia borealis F-4128]